MNRVVPSVAMLAGCLLALPALSQVYRCGDANSYSDQPCPGARNVDVRPNVMDAGPRMALPPVRPQPAIVLPDAPRVPAVSSAPSTIWERKAAEDAAHTSRTTGMRP